MEGGPTLSVFFGAFFDKLPSGHGHIIVPVHNMSMCMVNVQLVEVRALRCDGYAEIGNLGAPGDRNSGGTV